MGLTTSRTALYARAADFGTPCIAFALSALGCTTTLEPSVVVGDAGAGEEPPETCEIFGWAASEYIMCPTVVDHEEASTECVRRGAALVAIESQEENDFIAASSETVVMGDWWLGGRRDDEFVWRWPDGTVFWRGGSDGTGEDGIFVRWKAGEPNNASTTSPDPERCVVITPADDWNDRACALRVSYICERTP